MTAPAATVEEVRAEARRRWREQRVLQAKRAQQLQEQAQQAQPKGVPGVLQHLPTPQRALGPTSCVPRASCYGAGTPSTACGPAAGRSPPGLSRAGRPATALPGARGLDAFYGFLAFVGLDPEVPSYESFEPFFQRWFELEHFPRISQRLQYELRQRAKCQDFLSGLASQFRGWLLANTESLHATAWYEFSAKFALPAQFTDYCCLRMATVNLGSRSRPYPVTFYGAGRRWFLPPWTTVDVDNVALLDDLERDGSLYLGGGRAQAWVY
mmetsp:Transcript_2841/g.7895  ORF Transcript_2841/g.7895 Transcript_2841/m.7895 type:complete len:268 (-) Transcript_2841:31-834(-)